MANETELLTLLATQGAELEALRQQQTTAVIDTALMGAVSGIVHSGEAASQVVELLRGKFTVVNDQGGKPTVVSAVGYKPVADVVRETLASESYAHFRKSARGDGSPGTRGFSELPVDAQKNFGHAVIAQVLQNRADLGDPDPRMNPSRNMIRGVK